MKHFLIILICLSFTLEGISKDKDELLREWTQMSESKKALYKDFNDLKFGMFIHWGVYSTLGGIYNDKQIPSLGEWVMYNAKIPRAEYREVSKKFNPTGFNAEEWVLLAKEAGMKYIVAHDKAS